MGSVSYTILLSILMMTLKFIKKFNRWTKANTDYLDEVTTASNVNKNKNSNNAPTFIDIMVLLAIGFGVSSLL